MNEPSINERLHRIELLLAVDAQKLDRTSGALVSHWGDEFYDWGDSGKDGGPFNDFNDTK